MLLVLPVAVAILAAAVTATVVHSGRTWTSGGSSDRTSGTAVVTGLARTVIPVVIRKRTGRMIEFLSCS